MVQVRALAHRTCVDEPVDQVVGDEARSPGNEDSLGHSVSPVTAACSTGRPLRYMRGPGQIMSSTLSISTGSRTLITLLTSSIVLPSGPSRMRTSRNFFGHSRSFTGFFLGRFFPQALAVPLPKRVHVVAVHGIGKELVYHRIEVSGCLCHQTHPLCLQCFNTAPETSFSTAFRSHFGGRGEVFSAFWTSALKKS